MNKNQHEIKRTKKNKFLLTIYLNIFIPTTIIVLSIISGYYTEVWMNFHYDAVTTFWFNIVIISIVSLLLFLLIKYAFLCEYDLIMKASLLIIIPVCMYYINNYTNFIYIDMEKVIYLWFVIIYLLIDNILKKNKSKSIAKI